MSRITLQSMSGQFIIVLLVCLAYGMALSHDFTFDDRGLVLEDPRVAEADWGGVIGQSYWGDRGDGLYRPMTTASLVVNWLLCGDRAWGYHLFNIALHALAAALFYTVLTRQIGHKTGLAASIVFALHPAPSEAVFSIPGRAELLACCWGLGAVALALRIERGGRASWRLAGVFFMLLAAISSKENGMCFSLGLLAWDGLKYNKPGRIGLVALGAAVCGVSLKWLAIGSLGPEAIGYLDNPLAYVPAETRVAHGFLLIALALQKLIFPWPLVADYSHRQLPLYEEWLVWDLAFPALAIITLSAWLIYRLRNNRDIILWLGISGGAMFATSNLFVSSGTIFAERLLYMPSLAVSLLVGWLLYHFGRASLWKWVGLWSVVACAMLWGRSGAWRDDLSLFEDVSAKHPLSARGHFGRGLALHRMGDLADAVLAYERAEALYPRYFEAAYNQAAALVTLERFAEAEVAYGDVLAIRPNHYQGRLALALVLVQRGKLAGAATLFEQLYRERGERVVLHNLVRIKLQLGDREAGLTLLEDGLRRDPDDGLLLRLFQEAGGDGGRD